MNEFSVKHGRGHTPFRHARPQSKNPRVALAEKSHAPVAHGNKKEKYKKEAKQKLAANAQKKREEEQALLLIQKAQPDSAITQGKKPDESGPPRVEVAMTASSPEGFREWLTGWLPNGVRNELPHFIVGRKNYEAPLGTPEQMQARADIRQMQEDPTSASNQRAWGIVGQAGDDLRKPDVLWKDFKQAALNVDNMVAGIIQPTAENARLIPMLYSASKYTGGALGGYALQNPESEKNLEQKVNNFCEGTWNLTTFGQTPYKIYQANEFGTTETGFKNGPVFAGVAAGTIVRFATGGWILAGAKKLMPAIKSIPVSDAVAAAEILVRNIPEAWGALKAKGVTPVLNVVGSLANEAWVGTKNYWNTGMAGLRFSLGWPDQLAYDVEHTGVSTVDNIKSGNLTNQTDDLTLKPMQMSTSEDKKIVANPTNSIGAPAILAPSEPWAKTAGLTKTDLNPGDLHQLKFLGYTDKDLFEIQDAVFNDLMNHGRNPSEFLPEINQSPLVIFGERHSKSGREWLPELTASRFTEAKNQNKKFFSFHERDPRDFTWENEAYNHYLGQFQQMNPGLISHRDLKAHAMFAPVDPRPYPGELTGRPYSNWAETYGKALSGVEDANYQKGITEYPFTAWNQERHTRNVNNIVKSYEENGTDLTDALGLYSIGNRHTMTKLIHDGKTESLLLSPLTQELPEAFREQTAIITRIMPQGTLGFKFNSPVSIPHLFVTSNQPIMLPNNPNLFSEAPLYFLGNIDGIDLQLRPIFRALYSDYLYFHPSVTPRP